MSLRDKYTDEEWAAIPPFIGFSFDKSKKENQPREVIQNIVDKIHERRLSGKECEVAIMSDSDYDAIQSMNDFETHSIWISGCLLKIHSSQNLKDGEIEIY